MNPELTAVLPAYMEAENLAVLLPELRSTLDALNVTYEILVVDGRTPHDDTPAICQHNGVAYLARTGGDLYSHAIVTAIQASRGNWLVIMDADGSHPPSVIANLWHNRHDVDIVIASRYVSGGNTENPFLLILLSRIINIIFRYTFRLTCADVSNSYRLYWGSDIRSLTLTCENFDIVEEILIKLVLRNPKYRVKEIPFTFRKRLYGTTKRRLVLFALGYFMTLWKLARIARRSQNEVSQ